jgi:hypothetical protein
MHLTIDVFSGRPNPSWQLPVVVGRTVFELINDSGLRLLTLPVPFPSRLGYRGLQIGLPIDIVQKYRVSPLLDIPAVLIIEHLALFRELAGIVKFAGFLGIEELYKFVLLVIDLLQKTIAPPASGSPGATTTNPCPFEMLPFDPKPWNEGAYKPTNNCYAYASNKRAKYPSKPQPGIGSGAMFSSLSGADVAAAAKRDGAHDVGDCFPDSEAPRMLVALVIWPGNDYHWYRKHPDCWGHKPGSTDARNVDSSGAIIADPEKCDRGPYTVFHGYMLIPKSQKVAA